MTTTLVVLTLLGMGCSRVAGSTDGPQPDDSASPASSSAQTPSTPLSSATSAPSGDHSGEVRLTLNKPQYAPEDPLLVTIHNGLDQPIWARDMHSGCTAIVIERAIQGVWQPLEPCAGRRAPQMIPIPATSTLVQRIDYAQGTTVDSDGGWPTGSYRATLTYTMSQTFAAEIGTSVHSVQFAVR